jgi:hypothetical protein
MRKINWDELKKEYMLGNYTSINDLVEKKGLKRSGNFNKQTKGWAEEKAHKEKIKSAKTIEKTIEKLAEKEADRQARILAVSDKLLTKIESAITQLENYLVTKKVKTKTIEYDEKTFRPSKEVTLEDEVKEIVAGIIDKQGLKLLTAALKDIKEIHEEKTPTDTNETKSFEDEFSDVIDR